MIAKSCHVDAKKSADAMHKYAFIKKHPHKEEWTVYSENGRRMGTYKSRAAAKKRLRQIEFFKHQKSNDVIEPNFHGGKPSFLDVEIKESSLAKNKMEIQMKNSLYKLAKNLKNISHDSEADDVMDLAKSIQTSSSETEFVKDLEEPTDKDKSIAGDMAKANLTVMLAYLRAMQAWFHGAHHVTGGEGFSGDHSDLYERIYKSIIDDYDAAAEKAVGLSDESLACPIKVMDHANKIISKFKSPCDLSAVEIARYGHHIVMKYLDFLDILYDGMKERDELTLGLDDFIMSMANNYETFVYLLKQRSSDYKSRGKSSRV